jgi:hypothetical protein
MGGSGGAQQTSDVYFKNAHQLILNRSVDVLSTQWPNERNGDSPSYQWTGANMNAGEIGQGAEYVNDRYYAGDLFQLVRRTQYLKNNPFRGSNVDGFPSTRAIGDADLSAIESIFSQHMDLSQSADFTRFNMPYIIGKLNEFILRDYNHADFAYNDYENFVLQIRKEINGTADGEFPTEYNLNILQNIMTDYGSVMSAVNSVFTINHIKENDDAVQASLVEVDNYYKHLDNNVHIYLTQFKEHLDSFFSDSNLTYDLTEDIEILRVAALGVINSVLQDESILTLISTIDAEMDEDMQKSVGQLKAGMASINATESSALLIGIANIKKQNDRNKAKHKSELRYDMLKNFATIFNNLIDRQVQVELTNLEFDKSKFNTYAGIISEFLKLGIDNKDRAINQYINYQKVLLDFVSANITTILSNHYQALFDERKLKFTSNEKYYDLFKQLLAVHFGAGKEATQLMQSMGQFKSDLVRIYTALMLDYFDTVQTMQYNYHKFFAEGWMYVGNMLGAAGGGTITMQPKQSKSSSALAGALSGAAAGAAVGGPPGAAIGGILGGIGGLLQ